MTSEFLPINPVALVFALRFRSSSTISTALREPREEDEVSESSGSLSSPPFGELSTSEDFFSPGLSERKGKKKKKEKKRRSEGLNSELSYLQDSSYPPCDMIVHLL